MNISKRAIVTIITLGALVPTVTVAEPPSPLFKECQKSCAGNGLSCVKKCVAAKEGTKNDENGADTGTVKKGDDHATKIPEEALPGVRTPVPGARTTPSAPASK